MMKLITVISFVIAVASAHAAQAPETSLMTGPSFQQVPSSQILLNLNGTPTTLGAAFGGACGVSPTGCTSAGPVLTTNTGTMSLIAAGDTTAIGSNFTFDYSTGSVDARWLWWNNTLAPTAPTSNIWEQDTSYVTLAVPSGSGGAITAAVSGGAVTTLSLTAGSGYPNGTYALVFQGGGGNSAVGTLTVSGGQFSSYNITNAGSGYTTAPGVVPQIAVANGEINGRHTNINILANAYSAQSEDHEVQLGNAGAILSWNGLLFIPTNGATGIVTGKLFSAKFQLTNSNTTIGAIAGYAAIDNEAMGGGGSSPTNYWFIRQADPTAASNFSGNITIGSLTPSSLSINFSSISSGSSGSTTNIQAKNSSGNIFTVVDNGVMTTPPTNKIGAFNSTNFVTITGVGTGGAPSIKASGTDTNINLALQTTGTGTLTINGTSGVACSGAPTASFASTDGLVTHC